MIYDTEYLKKIADSLNDGYIKMPGLDMKYYFVFRGNIYAISTVDITHGNKRLKYIYPKYETMIFPTRQMHGVFEIDTLNICCFKYFTEQEAIQGHEKIIQDLYNGTATYFYEAVNDYEEREYRDLED